MLDFAAFFASKSHISLDIVSALVELVQSSDWIVHN
jgi:hypothetical protein